MFNWLRNLKRGQKYDLSSIMSLCNPEAGFSERVLWVEQLVDWLRSENQTTRVKFLLQVFARTPEWREKTGQLIASLLIDAKITRLFSETGVPTWMSITHEFWSRFIRVFLPRFSDDEDKSGKDAFAQIFYESGDPDWVSALPDDIWNELIEALAPAIDTATIREKLFFELTEACLILSMKCGAIMVREDFAVRAPELGALTSHPALNLQQELLRFQKGSTNLKEISDCLMQMETVSTTVKEHLERYGVSIDLVFQRERLKQYVFRIRYLVHAAQALKNPTPENVSVHSLFVELIGGSTMDQDFSSLVRQNLALASKKVIDFTGSTGSHYIARNAQEMKKLFWGAVGGGMITAFAVLIKYGIDRSQWPMVLDFFYAGINYSTAFLVIHFCHCTLATKQPSMTAAALANKIHTRHASGEGDQEFALEIKRLIFSQTWSIVGNLIAVIPVAILLEQVWFYTSGHHYFDPETAEHLIGAVSPWRSGAIIYASMTGGLLWLGGITSGWMENAAVYHRIPKLIEHHKVLRKVLGVKLTTKFAKAFLQNISGVTSSIALGFLLAGWPILGKFLGLPLDIRHVTFSTGATAAAISSIGPSQLEWTQWVEILLGISLIGVFNFLVSFLLALAVAVRAKEVRFKRAVLVLKLVLRPKEKGILEQA